MDDNTKPWWQSRTIWASLLTVLFGIAQTLGLLTADQIETILGELPALIVGLITVALGAWKLYGRAKAKTTITATK